MQDRRAVINKYREAEIIGSLVRSRESSWCQQCLSDPGFSFEGGVLGVDFCRMIIPPSLSQ
jgi:hypothetical protein